MKIRVKRRVSIYTRCFVAYGLSFPREGGFFPPPEVRPVTVVSRLYARTKDMCVSCVSMWAVWTVLPQLSAYVWHLFLSLWHTDCLPFVYNVNKSKSESVCCGGGGIWTHAHAKLLIRCPCGWWSDKRNLAWVDFLCSSPPVNSGIRLRTFTSIYPSVSHDREGATMKNEKL